MEQVIPGSSLTPSAPAHVYASHYLPFETKRTEEVYPWTGQRVTCCMCAEDKLRKILLYMGGSAPPRGREDPAHQMREG